MLITQKDFARRPEYAHKPRVSSLILVTLLPSYASFLCVFHHREEHPCTYSGRNMSDDPPEHKYICNLTLRSWSCWKCTAHIVNDERRTAPTSVSFAPLCCIHQSCCGINRSMTVDPAHRPGDCCCRTTYANISLSLFTPYLKILGFIYPGR